MKLQLSIILISIALWGCSSPSNVNYESALTAMNAEISRIEKLRAQEKIEKYQNREYVYCNDYGCGIKRVNGETVLPANYKILTPHLHNKDRGYLAFTYSEDGLKSGLMTYDYKKITPAIFRSNSIPPVMPEQGFLTYGETVNEQQKMGVIGTSGVIFPPKFDNIFHVHGDIFTFRMHKNGKWGLIKENGDILLNEQLDLDAYSYDNPIDGGKAFVLRQDGQYFLVNESGKTLISFSTESIEVQSKQHIIFKKDNLYGLMSFDGKEILEPVFDKLSVYSEGDNYVRAQKADHFGCYNTTEELWEKADIYEDLTCPNNYYHGAAKINGKWFIFNKDGSLDRSLGFDFISSVSLVDEDSKGYLKVSRNGKHGIIDSNGRIVIPLKYEWIEGFDPENEVALVRQSNARQGNIYITVDRHGSFKDSIKGRSNIREVGDKIYAIHDGYWFSAGNMKNVVYYDLRLKRILSP
tara:strand:- start:3431 stop:4828 length:1398 start_codon:yes stop_codon:yes gene_type:complete